MTWTAYHKGQSIHTSKTKGSLLRELKSKGVVKKYWYEKVRRPIAAWVSSIEIEIKEDGNQS